MAFKVVHQSRRIALVGYASSAAARASGSERAPEALRAAGLGERLKALGFEVGDFGDTAVQVFQPDDDHPRARNVPSILKAVQDLRPRVEAAVKSGALPLILCGDSVGVMAAIAGVRRYYRAASLIYISRHVDLQVPATTPDGSVNGMVVAQVTGRGAPELTRFWGEPPLVREPDVTLFGYDHLSPSDEQYLLRSPLRRYSASEIAATGGAAAARAAVQRIAAAKQEFVLHLDVNAISAGYNSDALPAQAGDTPGGDDIGGAGGLSRRDALEALREFARQPTLAALDVSGYNPSLDADGSVARRLVDFLCEALSARLEPETAGVATTAAPAAPDPPVAEPADSPAQASTASGDSSPADGRDA